MFVKYLSTYDTMILDTMIPNQHIVHIHNVLIKYYTVVQQIRRVLLHPDSNQVILNLQINSQVLSQPWMKGLGQSVGGMLTAAPGGGTGGDKAQGEVGHWNFKWDDFRNDFEWFWSRGMRSRHLIQIINI